MNKSRQQRKQEEVRRQILDVAREIITNEGLEGLSIRKITNSLEYSPAIIYHYFKDKNEIIETIMAEGFGKILSAIQAVEMKGLSPDQEIIETFKAYIEATLEYPTEYKAFVLNDDPAMLNRMTVLERGATEKRATLKALKGNIERGVKLGLYKDYDPELTAQIIWTSISGLLIRLIIEKDTSKEQRDMLIKHQFTMLFEGLKNVK